MIDQSILPASLTGEHPFHTALRGAGAGLGASMLVGPVVGFLSLSITATALDSRLDWDGLGHVAFGFIVAVVVALMTYLAVGAVVVRAQTPKGERMVPLSLLVASLAPTSALLTCLALYLFCGSCGAA